jgi:hypothetical protein
VPLHIGVVKAPFCRLPVRENPLNRILLPESGWKKRVFPQTIIV